MKIDKIIYNTTRGLISLEKKLSIASIFLFCYQLDKIKLAELLYTEHPKQFIDSLHEEYKDYEVSLKVDLDNENVLEAFNKTKAEIIKIYDDNGYYKALFNKDPYALAIHQIVNIDFDKINFKRKLKNIDIQLKLDFGEG